MRAKNATKVLNPNQPTERLGLIFIQQAAHELRAIWRPTPNDDYGLDGELEFTRDGVVTGYIVKVQIKSGASYLRNKTTNSFDYYVSPSDAAYWAKANFPVILLVYDPTSQAGYWVDVKRHLTKHGDSVAASSVAFAPAMPYSLQTVAPHNPSGLVSNCQSHLVSSASF